MKNFLLLSLILLSVSIVSSCGGEDIDCTNPNINQEWADEFQAALDAGTAYATDPTSENCNAYRDALQDYLDVVKDYEECADTPEEQQDFDEAVQEAQGVINTLSC